MWFLVNGKETNRERLRLLLVFVELKFLRRRQPTFESMVCLEYLRMMMNDSHQEIDPMVVDSLEATLEVERWLVEVV